MNARQWRQLGYKTLFRHGSVYLYRPLSGVVVTLKIERGDWMEHDNVNAPPWLKIPNGIDGLPAASRADIMAAARCCYCDQGVGTCDFCTGLRRPPDVLVSLRTRVGFEHYPPDWPACSCGLPVLDGHLTCGKAPCDEAGAREEYR
jgi:hypothetical protein